MGNPDVENQISPADNGKGKEDCEQQSIDEQKADSNGEEDTGWNDDRFVPKRAYGRVAYRMAEAGSEFAIFRKIGDISMLSLLGLQADVLELRKQFWLLCGDEETSGWKNPYLESFASMRQYHQDHLRHDHQQPRGNTNHSYGSNAKLEETRSAGSGDDGQRACPYCLLKEIREKLKEYHETLLRLVDLESMERPNKNILDCFRTWTFRMSQNKQRLRLYEDKGFLGSGLEEFWTWYEPEGLEDLVTIQQQRSQRDPFVQYTSHKLYTAVDALNGMHVWTKEKLHILREKIRRRNSHEFQVRQSQDGKQEDEVTKVESFQDWETSLRSYNLHCTSVVTSFLVAMVGALFPVLSILILFSIKHTLKRIYALIGLTMAFALAVKWTTQAKTADVFSITAAFAAVEVVFVGSAGV